MALNDGFAVDAQGRRIYFPPIGEPRLVPSREEEARFNGTVFGYGFVLFVIFAVMFSVSAYRSLLPESASKFDAGSFILPFLFLLIAVRAIAASVHARRWPVLNDRNFTYHRFVVSTLSRQSSVWLGFKLLLNSVLAIGVVALVGAALLTMHVKWTTIDNEKMVDLLLPIPLLLAVAPHFAVYAYRVRAAIHRQRKRRAPAT